MQSELSLIAASWDAGLLAGLPDLSGLLTPVIAVIAAYIAYQQWRLNRASLKNRLYGRRLTVYQGLVELLHQAGIHGTLDDEQHSRFHAVRFFADFLFEEETITFLDEVEERAAKLKELLAIDEFQRRTAAEGVGAEDPAEREERQRELAALRKWFKFQYANCKDRFRGYFEIKV